MGKENLPDGPLRRFAKKCGHDPDALSSSDVYNLIENVALLTNLTVRGEI